ncbi:unnamed protein product [Protopolystoma xenopodis]|uniref:Uncharacterized protein n=1 Tax=Protopolystoma xenopodis TaxID=117903 RepID=A0A3S5FBT2_9PLAT|nr:unnamed protein product [Protopolystoma xenopodis]
MNLLFTLFTSFLGVQHPPTKLLSSEEVFDKATGKPQIDLIRNHLISEGRLADQATLRILNETATILRSEKNMLDLEAPITGTLS